MPELAGSASFGMPFRALRPEQRSRTGISSPIEAIEANILVGQQPERTGSRIMQARRLLKGVCAARKCLAPPSAPAPIFPLCGSSRPSSA